MDLLIHLIRKNEVDIYDIPIALITDQFMAYIELMNSLNINLAGDFILMAATLTQIKSKMLLPVYEPEEEEEDPRLEITRPLLEYLQIKSAADSLGSRNLLGDRTFPRGTPSESSSFTEKGKGVKAGLFELIDAFQVLLKKIPESHRIDLSKETISIKDKISELITLLEHKKTVTFNELFSQASSKTDIITTFLAILEMVKLSLLTVVQHGQSDIIRLFYQ